MTNINPIKLNKIRDSIQTGRQGTPNPQSVDFKKVLFDLKMKQMEAWSGLLGDEQGSRTESPMAGYQDLLLNSLKSMSAKTDSLLQPRISNYQSIEKAYHSQPALPASGSADIRDLVSESAKKYGVPEPWFEKLIRQESSFDPIAVSPKGAMGLGQLMPATAKELGLRVGLSQDHTEGSVWHPASNLDASARYLRQLHDRYADMGIEENEAWKFAAGAYNAGMGNIQKAIDGVESGEPLQWEQVAKALPEVTGKHAQETLRYVGNLSSLSAES